MQNKVLILGGYGNFGKYIARTLLEQRIPVILAGRKKYLLEAEREKLRSSFKNESVQITTMDINNDCRQYLSNTKPKVVLNTCGPFQTASYNIVSNCIDAGVNYVDLADGRQFVKNMSQFHQKALDKNVTVITGASSVPGLSSAVIDNYYKQFSSIDKIQYGISPGQRTNRGGEATVKGVMGYIGKPIPPFGNLQKPIYGWQDIYAQQYPQLGYRLFGNCQVPDLDIFPKKYGIKELRFSAGTESKVLHLGIWLTSWLIRIGVPINLPKYSSFLLKASHVLFDSLGTDEGGMHIKIYGTNKNGKKALLKWFIIVRKGDGPNVPVVPAIFLAKKMCESNYQLPGVHVCAGLVTLDQYLDGLSKFSFQTYVEREELKNAS